MVGALDKDGVAKLYPDGLGLAFGLGTADPNDTSHLVIENLVRAQQAKTATSGSGGSPPIY